MSSGYPADWNQRRRKVYRRDSYTCQECGRRGGRRGDAELHAHHIVPKSKGGSHKLKNLKTLCRSCHGQAHSWLGATTHRPQNGFWGRMYESADAELNNFYGGCPGCGEASLSVRWESVSSRKEAKVVQCTSCGAMHDERIEQGGTSEYLRLVCVEGLDGIEATATGTLQEIQRFRIREEMHTRGKARETFGICPDCGEQEAITLNSILCFQFFNCSNCNARLRKKLLRSEWTMTRGSEANVGQTKAIAEWTRPAEEDPIQPESPETATCDD